MVAEGRKSRLGVDARGYFLGMAHGRAGCCTERVEAMFEAHAHPRATGWNGGRVVSDYSIACMFAATSRATAYITPLPL